MIILATIMQITIIQELIYEKFWLENKKRKYN